MLFEAKGNAPEQLWGISFSAIYQESFIDAAKSFPHIEAKVGSFFSQKLQNPLSNKYGKHDRPMTGALVGLWHCHLQDDAVLIYLLKNRCVHLVCIVPHSDLEGKRLRSTRSRIKNAGKLPESRGLADMIIEAMKLK